MLYRSLAESAGHFLQPVEFENVANPDFESLKHLQKCEHLPLTEASIYCIPVSTRICLDNPLFKQGPGQLY